MIFANAEIDLLALTILFLIYINVRRHKTKYTLEQKIFLGLMASCAMPLVLDAIFWLVNGNPLSWLRIINQVSMFFTYLLNPVSCFLWSLYAHLIVYGDERKTKKLIIPLAVPIFINAALTVGNLQGGFFYYIDPANVYHRGEFYMVSAAVCYMYLVAATSFVVLKHRMIENKYFIPVLAFAIPPFIGGIIQTMFYGVTLIWPCLAISVLIIFINIQHHQLYTDHLTGLFNRRQLEHFLRDANRGGKKEKLLGGIMIDINSFKSINDRFGHSAGDEALSYTGEILKKSLRREDFVSRYGGDEFLILIEVDDREQLVAAVDRIRCNLSAFNEKKIVPYDLDLSIGYDINQYDRENGLEQFLRDIDQAMYDDKKIHKMPIL